MIVDIQKAADALEMVSEDSADWFDTKTQEHIGVNDFMESEFQLLLSEDSQIYRERYSAYY